MLGENELWCGHVNWGVESKEEELWAVMGEARKALDGEEAIAPQRSHPTLPQYPLHVADSTLTNFSAPSLGDCWVNVKAELRPLGGSRPCVSMVLSSQVKGLTLEEGWTIRGCGPVGGRSRCFLMASRRMSSSVLRP